MVMQVDVNQENINTIKNFVGEQNIDVAIQEGIDKAIHNMAYDAEIRQGLKDLAEGRVVTYTEEEWEKLGREYGFH